MAEIINLRHPLVRLAAENDWAFWPGALVFRVGPGQPARLVAVIYPKLCSPGVVAHGIGTALNRAGQTLAKYRQRELQRQRGECLSL